MPVCHGPATSHPTHPLDEYTQLASSLPAKRHGCSSARYDRSSSDQCPLCLGRVSAIAREPVGVSDMNHFTDPACSAALHRSPVTSVDPGWSKENSHVQ